MMMTDEKDDSHNESYLAVNRNLDSIGGAILFSTVQPAILDHDDRLSTKHGFG